MNNNIENFKTRIAELNYAFKNKIITTDELITKIEDAYSDFKINNLRNETFNGVVVDSNNVIHFMFEIIEEKENERV